MKVHFAKVDEVFPKLNRVEVHFELISLLFELG
jgi:hypothetical protein